MKNPWLTSQSLLHRQNLHRNKSKAGSMDMSLPDWGQQMITFILLFFFFVLAIVLAGVAYSANSRKRSGMSEVPHETAHRPSGNRTSPQN